jgi:hypothetical protein
MKTRKLGKLEVSKMGFGCMSISANYGPAADKHQGIDVIRAAMKKASRFTCLSLAKTSSATKNCAILGSEGLNTISIASTGHR